MEMRKIKWHKLVVNMVSSVVAQDGTFEEIADSMFGMCN